MIDLEHVLFIHDKRNGRSKISATILLENLPLDFLSVSIEMNKIVSFHEELGYRMPLVGRLNTKLEELVRRLEEGGE
jgi:hypothetical protein